MVYQLHFISQEAIVDLNKKVSRVFGDKPETIIDYLSKDPVNGLGFEANGMYSNGFSDTGTGNTKTYGLIGSMANVPYITPDNYQGTVQVIVNY